MPIVLENNRITTNIQINAKPFLKWAGGKTQLISELEQRLPQFIRSEKIIDKYFELFIGGGAFFFYLKKHYEIRESFLFDINRELILEIKVSFL